MGYNKQINNQKRYRINNQINADEVRLLDETSKQIGVMSMAEARQHSFDASLDLVEIAPLAKPPVVKLISYSKFLYQESKKLKAEKKGNKGGEMKEIQMTPFISQNDFDTRIKRTLKFLSAGNKIKLSVKFQGRQLNHKQFGYDVVEKFKKALVEVASPEGEPKLIGKRLMLTLSPIKKKIIKNEESK